MPKKKEPLSPQEQSERFRQHAEKLIAAGELSPTEADAALDSVVRKAAIREPQKTPDS